MIKSIELYNFKCFREQYFPIKPLTVLSGINGVGKSSVIQSIMLARQSRQKGQEDISHLVLNGDLTHIGTSGDLLCAEANDERGTEIELGFTSIPQPLVLRTRKEDASDTDVCEIESADITSLVDEEPIFTDDFQYLKAERIGPRTSLPTSEYLVQQQHRIGYHGELVGQFLFTFEKAKIPALCLQHDTESDSSIGRQTEAWLSEISPAVRLKTEGYKALDSVQMRFSYLRGREESDSFRATNVGLGISYTLPIIVALLTPFPNSLIVLENPECHVHPAGQSAMGRLIACAAAAGHQVIVETHSDHILNGIRVAVMQKKLSPENVSTIYLAPNPDSLQPDVYFPQLDSRGRFDHWPNGFFDQWEKDLEQLI